MFLMVYSFIPTVHPPQWKPEGVFHFKKYENTLNVNGLEFPMKLKDISNFEKMNNLSLNVYGPTDTKFRFLKFQITIKIMKCTLTFCTIVQRKIHIMLTSKFFKIDYFSSIQ